jgi:hypothetical protein
LEIEQTLGKTENLESNADFNSQLRKEIEKKFIDKRKFLEASLKRAEFEEFIHLKQENYNKYDKMFKNYAFPPIEHDNR